jgi:hypothetical protein
MKPNLLTCCPYTLKPISELEEKSREHVILDALGGPDGYTVTACRTVNSKLGETVDAAFLTEPMVELARSKAGVKSRSGVASWNLHGETVEGKRPVDLTFPHEGPIDVYHRKPVERGEDGNSFKIIAPPDQADRLLKEIEANLNKKGREIARLENNQSPNQEIHIQMTVNMTVMRTGLMKIAYLACCEFFGDDFLDDPLNTEWQKAIRAQTGEESDNIRIHGQCFDGATIGANMVFPSLAKHEHGIAIANLNQRGPVVAVRLFGNELLTAFALASETNDYGLAEGDGLLLICDSKTGAISREPWSNHLLRMSGLTPPSPSIQS